MPTLGFEREDNHCTGGFIASCDLRPHLDGKRITN